MKIIVGISIPFVGTTLGAAMVFFMKKEISPRLRKLLPGFAAGVMIAASVWSLLIPAIEMAEVAGTPGWIPALAGFLAGIGFLLLLDNLISRMRGAAEASSISDSSLMLALSVTLHNIPEGMAVGVVLAGMLSGDGLITSAVAYALALGIGIQNFPEGAIISMPMASSGTSRGRAFYYGFLSGVVEPVGAVITILLTSLVVPILPFVLSFAAGAMIYVVVEELIPSAQAGSPSCIGVIGVALGFALMMVLDVTLG